jgi:membrane protein implicated in regulation of membrane protease activity
MDLATVATVIAATLAGLATVVGVIAWFYRRGRSEQSLSNSVERHAEATEMLAGQVGGLRDTLEEHGNLLVEHHWRLRALEGSK